MALKANWKAPGSSILCRIRNHQPSGLPSDPHPFKSFGVTRNTTHYIILKGNVDLTWLCIINHCGCYTLFRSLITGNQHDILQLDVITSRFSSVPGTQFVSIQCLDIMNKVKMTVPVRRFLHEEDIHHSPSSSRFLDA